MVWIYHNSFLHSTFGTCFSLGLLQALLLWSIWTLLLLGRGYAYLQLQQRLPNGSPNWFYQFTFLVVHESSTYFALYSHSQLFSLFQFGLGLCYFVVHFFLLPIIPILCAMLAGSLVPTFYFQAESLILSVLQSHGVFYLTVVVKLWGREWIKIRLHVIFPVQICVTCWDHTSLMD